MNFRQLFRHIKVNIALPIYQKGLVWRLRHKKQINIVFIASTLAMWRYQNLYELVSKHSRFKASIIILPCTSYSKEQQKKDMEDLKVYFSQRKSNFIIGDKGNGIYINIREQLKPDIIFYPQPYIGTLAKEVDVTNFFDRLLCYCPYAFWISKSHWSYDLPFHNKAWKLFYPTELHRKDAQEVAFNKGRNIEVVGYANTDNFLSKVHKDVWKKQDCVKKRLIWAPHFTITPGYVTQSNFLRIAHFMLELAAKYYHEIQIAFKPHPRLYSELCKHKDWGTEKTRQYYNEWTIRGNTQVESGEFTDLFMTSDALIHDSGSFCVEYLYSGNPTMYIADNFEEQVAEKGEFGQLAMRQQYVGKTEEDIIRFIENTVIAGNDPMKHKREEFVKQYLLPPNGKTVAENTMDVLLKAFC